MAVYPGGTLALRTEEPKSLLALYDWTSLEEPTEGSDCFQQRLIDHACSGKSMCVMGAAGCGKTVAQRAIKAAMEAQRGNGAVDLFDPHRNQKLRSRRHDGSCLGYETRSARSVDRRCPSDRRDLLYVR